MKRLLRKPGTNLFLAPNLTWTDVVSKALAFASSAEAIEFHETHNLGDLELYFLNGPRDVSGLDFSSRLIQRSPTALLRPLGNPPPP